jgi:hypothetical protein
MLVYVVTDGLVQHHERPRWTWLSDAKTLASFSPLDHRDSLLVRSILHIYACPEYLHPTMEAVFPVQILSLEGKVHFPSIVCFKVLHRERHPVLPRYSHIIS